MKTRRGIDLKTVLLLSAATALVFAIFPSTTKAVDCSTYSHCNDTDNDGYTDYEECTGIVSGSGAYITFPGLASDYPREERLDPEHKDLIAKLVPSPWGDSSLPEEPMNLLYNLGIMVHVLGSVDPNFGPDRQVTEAKEVTCGGVSISLPGQKGALIREDTDPSSTFLGLTWPSLGPPSVANISATVYTGAIREFINDACVKVPANSPGDCSDISGPSLIDTDADGIPEIRELLTRWVIAHEIGHILHLGVVCSDAMFGCHYMPDEHVIMSQMVTYESKKGGKQVIFTMGQAWKSIDPANAELY